MLKKILSTKFNDTQLNIALLILRVTAGALMAHHGYQKLSNFSSMEQKFMEFLGMSKSFSLSLAIGAEFFCSLFLIAGLFTRFIIVPLIVTMIVAVFSAHHGDIFGDGEHSFLYLAIYVSLLMKGAGKYSADALLFNKD